MKEMLENYNVFKAEIKSKEYEMRKLELEEASPSSSNLSINGDIRSKGYVSSNLENKAISNADKVKLLQLQINELKAKIEMIDSMMDTLNINDRSIIELRYFKKLKLESISVTVTRDISSIQRIIDKSINKMDKIYTAATNKVKIR